MKFARKVWKLLVAIKDGLALLLLLTFFTGLYAVLTMRPSAGQVREGALLLKLDGAVVEEPAEIDPVTLLLSTRAPTRQYRSRDVVRAVRAAADDTRIKAVVLDLSKFTGGGQVHMEDLGAAMDAVRARNKPVLTWAQAYTDDSVLLAAHSSEAWVDPMGGAFILGPGGNHLYFAGLIEKLKVNLHVFKVGTFKDFVEQYTRTGQSPESQEARSAVYQALWANWQDNVKKARPRANIALATGDPGAWFKAAGGDGAVAARNAGLIDRIGTRAEFGTRVAALVGNDSTDKKPGAFANTALSSWVAALPKPSSGKPIGVVTIAGEIVDGKAGPGTAGGERIADLLDKALDQNLAGLVIRVDSPGGSVAASEEIRTAIERHKVTGIPVAVSMANLAASGGYWVSTPGQRIFAEPGTITGSIGIFAIIPSFERTLAEYGVTSDGLKTTPLSGQPDPIGGLSPAVEQMLQANIENGYGRFLGLVAKSRGKTPAQVDTMAQGRVWDGGTARQLGLVDQFGGLDDALAWVAAQAKLKEGGWHPIYLGQNDPTYAALIDRIRGDDESQGRDFAGLIAERQRGIVQRALESAETLVKGGGAQALCLDCPVGAVAPAKSEHPSLFLDWVRSLLGLV
ncbi:MAG: sppA [Novosphingobium sp.]|nr:sppA [Novosphingobium sp.]